MSALLTSPVVFVSPSIPQIRTVRPDEEPLQPPTDVVISPHRRLGKSINVDVIAMFKVVEPIITKYSETLKSDMTSQGARYADGDHFGEAELRPSSSAMVIDPLKFYQLAKARGVEMKDIMGCLSVGKAKAEKILSQRDLASVSTAGPTKAAGLYVLPRKGVEVPATEEMFFLLGKHFEAARRGDLSPLKIAGTGNE